MATSEIFDRALRRLRRDRAAPAFAAHGFLRDAMVEGLLDRLGMVTRRFSRVLDLGTADGSLATALEAQGARVTRVDAGSRWARGGVQADEDRLPFADGVFDLVVSAGALDAVNDLPGALALARRVLMPDGLFLATFVGAGSLPRLRAAMLAADAATGGASPRIHPQVEVRAAGDLLQRAGFALAVADAEPLDVRYRDPLRLLADLRGMGAGNVLRARGAPLGRSGVAAMLDAWALGADAEGRVSEHFELLFLTGWAPAPDQPKPAQRGSATASLAAALKSSG